MSSRRRAQEEERYESDRCPPVVPVSALPPLVPAAREWVPPADIPFLYRTVPVGAEAKKTQDSGSGDERLNACVGDLVQLAWDERNNLQPSSLNKQQEEQTPKDERKLEILSILANPEKEWKPEEWEQEMEAWEKEAPKTKGKVSAADKIQKIAEKYVGNRKFTEKDTEAITRSILETTYGSLACGLDYEKAVLDPKLYALLVKIQNSECLQKHPAARQHLIGFTQALNPQLPLSVRSQSVEKLKANCKSSHKKQTPVGELSSDTGKVGNLEPVTQKPSAWKGFKEAVANKVRDARGYFLSGSKSAALLHVIGYFLVFLLSLLEIVTLALICPKVAPYVVYLCTVACAFGGACAAIVLIAIPASASFAAPTLLTLAYLLGLAGLGVVSTLALNLLKTMREQDDPFCARKYLEINGNVFLTITGEEL